MDQAEATNAWMHVPAARLSGKEAEVELHVNPETLVMHVTLLVQGRKVRTSVCTVDYFIEKVFAVHLHEEPACVGPSSSKVSS
jgi:hypothetical protein